MLCSVSFFCDTGPLSTASNNNPEQISSLLLLCRYLSAMGYAFDGYAQAEFSGFAYSCASGLAPSISGFLPQFLPNTPILRSPASLRMIEAPGAGCVVQLDSILTYFNLSRPFWMTCVILLGYLGVLHIATFIGLMQLTKKEKR